jgi:hypothetical protein
LLADDCGVCGDPPDPRQMCAGCEEVWGNTALLVVGAKDELGHRRCNWIGQVMVLAFVSNIRARQQECNGALAAMRFCWGRSLVGVRRRLTV